MYVWVVLTTFLAMIAAYVLPIRPDTEKMVNVPVAQARMIQLVAKQKAGEQYMKERGYPYYSTESERKVNYSTGEVSSELLKPYFPFGFVNNENYVTAIYCMDADLKLLKTGEDACQKTEAVKTRRMLITYGAIPERWQAVAVDGNSRDVRPAPDFMEAMREHFGSKAMVGYIVNENGKMYVMNYENTKFEVPQPIADDAGVVPYTLKACVNDYGTCLAYMSWR